MNDACDQGGTVEIESKFVVCCCLFVKKKSRENKDMKMIARMETEVECLVCGSTGKLGLHYGAVTCYKCRAFFRYNNLQGFHMYLVSPYRPYQLVIPPSQSQVFFERVTSPTTLAGVCQREKQTRFARRVGNVLWTSQSKSFALDVVYRNV